ANPVGSSPYLGRPLLGQAPALAWHDELTSLSQTQRTPVGQSHVWVLCHHLSGPLQRAWNKQVVSGQQHHIVALGPLQALVGRGDQPHVPCVATQLDAVMA